MQNFNQETKDIPFEYFSQAEADVFAFYMIPKELFTNARYQDTTCTDSKLLYGLLRDRNQLSLKNGWVDKEGHIFIIYPREEVAQVLGIGNQKANKLFKELNEVRLIREVRQGLNKPNLIYVGKIQPTKPENCRTYENHISGNVKITGQDIPKSHTSNTDLSNTDFQENLYSQEKKNTHTDLFSGNITPTHSTRAQEEKPVCEPAPVSLNASTPYLRNHPSKTSLKPDARLSETEAHSAISHWKHIGQLQKDIQATIGETIVPKRLKKLVHSSSVERIRYHLEHWHIHQQNQTRPGAGYFLTVVENDISPVAPPDKKQNRTEHQVSQRDNFEQREYSDEELERFYANLQVEEGESAPPVPPIPAVVEIPPPCDTFEQREYSDEELKHCSANLQLKEASAPPVPKAPVGEPPVCELVPPPFLNILIRPPTAPAARNVEGESDL